MYVNTNPKHHNISKFENYKYSSYKSLLSTKPTLIKRTEVIFLFETKENFEFAHNLKKLNIEAINEFLLE